MTIAETCVSGVTLIMLTIGLPLAARPACGISCTLSQKQRPSSVKHEHVVVRRRDEQVLDEILVLERLRRCSRARRAAASCTSTPTCA